LPLPRWDGEENGKKKTKTLGRDEGSLTEQQMKRTATTTILVRRIYETNNEMHRATLTAQCPVCSQATTYFPPGQLLHPEPSVMAHGIKHPVLFDEFGSAGLAVSPPNFW